MQRRRFLALLVPMVVVPAASIHGLNSDFSLSMPLDDLLSGPDPIKRLDKPRKEWRKLLTKEQYQVLFEEHTERAGTSPLDKEKRAGTFVCSACYLPLFDAANKYDSGTGWPSFHTAMTGRIGTKRDFKLILPRTEYHCVRCGGHQGHLFSDGPAPTGKRYCNNGVALRFIPKGESLPALRT